MGSLSSSLPVIGTDVLRPRTGSVVAVILLLIAAPRLVPAQYQVNPMASNSVNRAVYGGGGPSGCINFAGTPGGIQAKSSQAMLSENKYAAWSSGASRSDVKMGYNALGPRAAGGPQAYINYTPSYLAKSK